MTIEITEVTLKDRIIRIHAVDVSEEHLQRMERMRDDTFQRELEFAFDTRNTKEFQYIRTWLKRQKATRGAETWGDAMSAVIGTITSISGKYLELA